ncbi:hypothetical protein COB21_05760 [Candidatus Aerophobetes bacterium]|uniref:SET domain-containing protein n=1 Tax=Aerophobetes bacterium TaxID=2030807 RepID=A0A2A4WY38_UNCAE|nr:MAG: hypothetical protein COB21_05760 [Candidatus Aerophobetes bacterium]
MEGFKSLLKRKAGKFFSKIIPEQKGIEARLKWIDAGKKRLNHIDSDGNSITHRAVIEGREDVLKQFIGKGLRLDGKNYAGLSPLDLSLYLNRSYTHYFNHKPLDSIQIYRNKDQAIHSISIAELEKKLKFTFLHHLEFASYRDFLAMSKKGAKSLKDTQTRQMNHWMCSLHQNSMLVKPNFSHFYIRYISRYIGYGIFAAKKIPALTFIGEYTGVITPKFGRKKELNDYIFDYSAARKNSRFIIDASKKGNFTRFINHSTRPNLLARWIMIKGICHIIFFTKDPVDKDEQLTYNYGEIFWRRRFEPEEL